jgi:hypothetical protein
MGQVGFELQTHCTQAVNAGNLLTLKLKLLLINISLNYMATELQIVLESLNKMSSQTPKKFFIK